VPRELLHHAAGATSSRCRYAISRSRHAMNSRRHRARVARRDVTSRERQLEGLRDAAGAGRHHDQARREEQRLLDVVRDEEHRLAGARPHVEHERLHRAARHRVERAHRLVHQQHARLARERPRDADALLHAARQLVDARMRMALEADEREHLARARFALGLRHAREAQPSATFPSTSSHGSSAYF
jgi:hypothetical protein